MKNEDGRMKIRGQGPAVWDQVNIKMKNEDGRMKRNRCQSSEGRCRVSGFKFQGIVSRYVILILFLLFVYVGYD